MSSNTVAEAVEDAEYEAIVSETSPLIRRQSEQGAESDQFSAGIPKSLKRRVVFLIYLFAFIVILGQNFQPAARTQLYENVICRKYYQEHGTRPNSTSGQLPENGSLDEDLCKVEPIQRELALIKGYELLSQVVPNLLCTIPFGILSDRIGRKWVLGVSMVGILLSEMWTLAVCYWSDTLSIRLILLSGLLMVVGGGSSTVAALVHTITADVVDESERSQVFIFIHAASVFASIIGPVISAALMEEGQLWAVIWIGQACYLAVTILAAFIPETLGMRDRYTPASPRQALDDDSDDLPIKPQQGILAGMRATLAPLITTVSTDRQALLLFIIYAPLCFARDSFTFIGLMYVSKKFHIRFSLGNLLLSLQQAMQAVLLMLIIPGTTFLLSSPRSPLITSRLIRPDAWTSTWRRDRAYLTCSIGAMAIGQAVLGLAPTFWMAVAGLVAFAMSSAGSSIALSMLGSVVEPRAAGAVYSAALMSGIGLANTVAPLFSELFNLGMRLGWAWLGLPFLFTAGVAMVVWVLTFFISTRPPRIGS